MLIRDIRCALRSFLRAPGFTLVTLITLGLGIGGTTAIFSIVDGVVLRPLPCNDSSRLRLNRVSADGGLDSFSAPPVLACYVPARRAMRVDPMTALRSE